MAEEKAMQELIKGWPGSEYQIKEYCSSGRDKHSSILLCGKTGVGKSRRLINALIGQNLAKEGEDLDPETDEVG